MRNRLSRDRVKNTAPLVALAICALASCSLGATVASAQTAGSSSVLHAEFAPGLWIFIDPETGRITDQPSSEQAASLRAQVAALVNESTEGLVPTYHADGSKSLNLQGRFLNVSIATLSAGGTPQFACADSVHAAMAALLAKRQIPMLNGLETE